MQRDLASFWAPPAQQADQSDPPDAAKEPHWQSFTLKEKSEIRKIVKKKFRPRAPDLIFETMDEWVYYNKDTPEVNI